MIAQFDRKTSHLPDPATRKYWNAAALTEKDREIAALEDADRDRVLAACRSFLTTLHNREPRKP